MRARVKDKPVIDASDTPILGTYEGEALDTNITNNNGLDITAEVIKQVLASDEYAQGLENGWFIGFLGHPEDPNCMDFKDGCIVLTDMSIDDNGKVYAKFNLIDTPVGRIVKTLQDAGVVFGISIRGAGDIVGNSVDPDTFVFRGYDLVSFPAYPDSIPTFTAIAASTNLEDRKKYQAVCAAVKNNLSTITSASTIDVLKSQFAPQSNEYKLLESRQTELDGDIIDDVKEQKIEAMTQLYLDAMQNVTSLAKQLESEKRQNASISSATRRKLAAVERITASQLSDALSELDSIKASYRDMKHKNAILGAKLSEVKKTNLIYKQKVESSTSELRKKSRIIASLQKELSETVTASSKIKASASNLGVSNERLQDEVNIYKNQLDSYQQAYASMYAAAVGVDLGHLPITDSTSVEDLQDMIETATNTAGMSSMIEPVYIEDEDDTDIATL